MSLLFQAYLGRLGFEEEAECISYSTGAVLLQASNLTQRILATVLSSKH